METNFLKKIKSSYYFYSHFVQQVKKILIMITTSENSDLVFRNLINESVFFINAA